MHRSRPCLPAETPHQIFERLTCDLLILVPPRREVVDARRIYVAMHKMTSNDVALHKMSHPAFETEIPRHVFREYVSPLQREECSRIGCELRAIRCCSAWRRSALSACG